MNLPWPGDMGMRILVTLLGSGFVVWLFMDFRKGMKMGMSEKNGKELTITVWASIVLILLAIYLRWYAFFSA